ncbi:MAG: serine/threonine-protein phosphatase [Chloroflexota bacterium]|nr:serine/threonine-protein phosphatase [Chloroflexota bacterium]
MRSGVLSGQAPWATRQRGRGWAASLALLGGALALLGVTLGAVPVAAAPASPSRPTEAVAYARVAVARVLSYYYGKTANSGPIPILSPCIGDAALVGTTGVNLNSFNYALIPTALVNPIQPCQGAQIAFQQFNGQAATWGLIRIQVDLNVAYTGTDASQQGSVSFSIDPSQIRTTGAATGPQLLALPLAPTASSPSHDLPTLETPQPSDAPADPTAATLIDLTGQTGALLGASALTPDQVASTLYPVALPVASAFPQAAPTAAATSATASASPDQAQQTAAQLSLGAVEIDSHGRLIGMVGANSQGAHVLYGVGVVTQAIGSLTGKSGQLMSGWQTGLNAFYASPPQYDRAQQAFGALSKAYPDFAGVQPFARAAAQGSPMVPSLTSPGATPIQTPTTRTPGNGAGLGVRTLALLGGGLLVILIVGGAAAWLLRRRWLLARATPSPEEAMLDLLPPDMPLDAVPEDDTPTRPITRVDLHDALASAGLGGVSIADLATAHLPAVSNRVTSAPRKTSILVTQSAGMIDPGVKRRHEPNQDNIFALEGLRAEIGRLQPYSLLIVADGMGGHLNGQLASRLTIETVARTVAHALTSAQRFDGPAFAQLLVEGAQQAHSELVRRNMATNSDMGTTIVAALIVDDRAYLVNVGDSRAYLLNPDTGLRQITQDHSVVASLVAAGVIRPEDIYIHPRRNQIYRSLGGAETELEVDVFVEDLQAGDKLLLCSDGLWEMVRDPQIANILRGAADLRQATELLTREANANGGEDNIGVVVARVREGLPPNAEPGMRMIVGPQDTPAD